MCPGCILAEKNIKIDQQRLKLLPFIALKSVKLSSPKVFMGFSPFSPSYSMPGPF